MLQADDNLARQHRTPTVRPQEGSVEDALWIESVKDDVLRCYT